MDHLVVIPSRKDGGNSIVLIRLDMLGDFTLWLITARFFRKLYPGRKIILIANAEWSDFAKEFDYWDLVIPVKVDLFSNKISYRLKFLKKISQIKCEIAIQPTISRSFLVGDSIIRCINAAKKIGSKGDLNNSAYIFNFLANNWYSQLVENNAKDTTEIKKNIKFFEELSNNAFEIDFKPLPIIHDLAQIEGLEKDFFIIVPGTSPSVYQRRWPPERFALVADEIHLKTGWQTVICGGPDEKVLGDKVISNMKTSNFLNLVGKTSMQQFFEVIRGAKLLIGNESGCIHIASAVGTASVSVTGGGVFGRFIPYDNTISDLKSPLAVHHSMNCYDCRWNCIYKVEKNSPFPCIDKVRDIDVIQAASSQIDSTELNL